MELSVVVPLYHTAKHALQFLPMLIECLRSKYKGFEIIFVVDNENISDEIESLNVLQNTYSEIQLYKLNKNYGQHFATLCGYYLAKGEYILSVDEDMTEYAVEICSTDGYLNKDVFYFFYDKNKMYNSDTRKVLSNGYKYIIHKIVNLQKHSTFRVISKNLRDKMLKNKHIFWNLDVMIFNNTGNIGSKEVQNCTVTDSSSGYNYKKLFQVAFEIAYEHNTIFMNCIFAVIPALVYYIFYQDKMRAWVVYFFFAIIITLFFRLIRILSPSTEQKLLKALKQD